MNLVAVDPFKIDSKTVADFARVGVFHMPRRRDFRFTPTRLLKGEAIVCYCEPLITQQIKTSGSPVRVKIDEKKRISSDLYDYL